MTGCRFDYAKLPYGRSGQHLDHNRFNWRCELLLTRNSALIRDKVVLDLACNNGRLSYPCLEIGAKKVVGVEARQETIDTGKRYLDGTGHEARMEWVRSDAFDFLAAAEPGTFDTILCFGFLYHTVRQVEFFREIARLAPAHVIIDTCIAKNYLWYGFKSFLKRPPAMFVAIDDPGQSSDTTDGDGVVFYPSTSFLELMFETIGYDWRRIRYSGRDIKDWRGLEVYKRRLRASYVANRRG